MEKEVIAEDRLASLEEQILQYFLSKGYKLLKDQGDNDHQWSFYVQLESVHKEKDLKVWIVSSDPTVANKEDLLYHKTSKTLKEMYDEAFEFFKIEGSVDAKN